MKDGDSQDVVPEIKPIDQRKVLFEQLKGTFERKELIKEAKAQGISERTAERWNDKWLEQRQVIKLEHDKILSDTIRLNEHTIVWAAGRL